MYFRAGKTNTFSVFHIEDQKTNEVNLSQISRNKHAIPLITRLFEICSRSLVDIDIGKLQNLSGKLQNSGKFRINATNDVEQISNNRVITDS